MNIDGTRTQIKALIDERAATWERMKTLAFGEDGLKNEDVEAYDAAEARLNEIDAQVTRLERAIELAKPQPLPVHPGGVAERHEPTPEAYAAAFTTWLKRGMEGADREQRNLLESRLVYLDGAESRALGIASGAVGGYTVPEGFYAQIVTARKAFGGILNAPVTFIPTASGADLPIPTADDTGNVGELLAEGSPASEQDITFGQKILKAEVWSSKIVRVALTLLQDSGVDIEAFLAARFGERLGRVQSSYLITGTGTGQPEGILTNCTTGVTAAARDDIEYAELVELEHSIDTVYRQVGHYLLSDSALKVLRQKEDDYGRPLWVPGMAVGAPNRINGYAYTVDVNMPTVYAEHKPIIFGDLSHYWVRDVQGIQMLRLVERYAEYLQVGFLAFMRMDARPVVAGGAPFKCLEMLGY